MSEHERVMVCTSCGVSILVCCHVSDLDPKTYVGLACGCMKPKDAPAASVAVRKARQAQKAAR